MAIRSIVFSQTLFTIYYRMCYITTETDSNENRHRKRGHGGRAAKEVSAQAKTKYTKNTASVCATAYTEFTNSKQFYLCLWLNNT